MKIILPKYFIFLFFISTLLLALGLGIYNFQINQNPTQVQVDLIKANIQREIGILEKEAPELAELLEQKGKELLVTFTQYNKHSYFVFKNKGLFFWSDYRFIPKYTDLQGNYKYKVFDFSAGKYLVHQTSIQMAQDTLEIYSFLPIYKKYKVENAYLKSAYNEEIIPDPSIVLSSDSSIKAQNIYAPAGEFLFSIEPNEIKEVKNKTILYGFVFSLFLCAFSTALLVSILVKKMTSANRYEAGFSIWLGYFLIVRALMIYFQFPGSIIDIELFKISNQNNSLLSPSVGDLFINVTLLVFLLDYILRNYAKFRFYKKLVHSTDFTKYGISLLIVFLSYWALFAYFQTLNNIYFDANLTLDITERFNFSLNKIICLLIFLFISIVYFIEIHILCRLFIRINPEHNFVFALLFLIASILYTLTAYFTNTLSLIVIIVNFVYFLVLYYLRLPKYLYNYRYITTIYLFIGALACSVMITDSIYTFEAKRSIDDKRKFASRFFDDKDILAEQQLETNIEDIKKDNLIAMVFNSPFISKKLIAEKIKKTYLRNYFDKYQVQVSLFDRAGNAFAYNSEMKKNYKEYFKQYDKIYYETDISGIYFINEVGVNLMKQYVSFIEIKRKNKITGYIILDLNQKRIVSSNVYPELLLNKQFVQPEESKQYSYALYEDNELKFSYGNYNYEKDFEQSFFNLNIIDGFTYNNYHHLVLEGGGKKRVVVSAPVYPWGSILSNFSFYFLLLVFCIINFIITYSVVVNLGKVRVSFATRIQFYLNTAFFLPLFIVSFTILSVISVNYQEDFTQNFIEKTENVSLNIQPLLDDYKNNLMTREKLYNRVSEIAQFVNLDLNIFDDKGELIVSSQPAIYENNGLLSVHINPEAYWSIQDKKNKIISLSESVGDLSYKSVYLPLKKYESGELMGILSVPFFESRKELDEKIVDVFTSIINIFTIVFIVFVVLSYFASRILTYPLQMITQKIRKTTLSDYNEPLEWNSEDEIGLLVDEYNSMLKKLETSKKALAQNEKETAWREMAKQVAHEIKNPLTPMKLTLQMMQVKLQRQGEEVQETFERSFDVLLTQVDILNDIATSFSAFAKMPIPETERFEVSSVLKETIDLYKNNQEADLLVQITKGNFHILGDKKLMGRIFTNLILNAIQAGHPDRRTQIEINLNKSSEEFILIEIRDNGMGIDEEIKEKIFVPNFTTKLEGSGIGLAVAKRGVEHAGGRIWFDTEPEIGTSFFIEVPLVD